MVFVLVFATVLIALSPSPPEQAADGFLVCSATPTRMGTNRVALLNLSYGDEARKTAMSDEFRDWMRNDATVAKNIERAGIDPRGVRAQSKVECVWAKDQSAAEGIAVRLANRLRADNIKVLPTNWAPKIEKGLSD